MRMLSTVIEFERAKARSRGWWLVRSGLGPRCQSVPLGPASRERLPCSDGRLALPGLLREPGVRLEILRRRPEISRAVGRSAGGHLEVTAGGRQPFGAQAPWASAHRGAGRRSTRLRGGSEAHCAVENRPGFIVTPSSSRAADVGAIRRLTARADTATARAHSRAGRRRRIMVSRSAAVACGPCKP